MTPMKRLTKILVLKVKDGKTALLTLPLLELFLKEPSVLMKARGASCSSTGSS